MGPRAACRPPPVMHGRRGFIPCVLANEVPAPSKSQELLYFLVSSVPLASALSQGRPAT